MLEGLALPERCIIKTDFDAITSQTQWKDKALCHLCSLALWLGRAINDGLAIPNHVAYIPDWNAKIP
jgi:hypothetical protein